MVRLLLLLLQPYYMGTLIHTPPTLIYQSQNYPSSLLSSQTTNGIHSTIYFLLYYTIPIFIYINGSSSRRLYIYFSATLMCTIYMYISVIPARPQCRSRKQRHNYIAFCARHVQVSSNSGLHCGSVCLRCAIRSICSNALSLYSKQTVLKYVMLHSRLNYQPTPHPPTHNIQVVTFILFSPHP